MAVWMAGCGAVEGAWRRSASYVERRSTHRLRGGCASDMRAEEYIGRGFEDLALLDGHYLRRSDAEIFGDREDTQGAASMTANRISGFGA